MSDDVVPRSVVSDWTRSQRWRRDLRDRGSVGRRGSVPESVGKMLSLSDGCEEKVNEDRSGGSQSRDSSVSHGE